MTRTLMFLLTSVSLVACGDEDPQSGPPPDLTFPGAREIVWDLTDHGTEVTPLFTDYGMVMEDIMELDSGFVAAPDEIGGGTAFMLTGVNRSDDLWMSMSAPVESLSATTAYELSVRVVVATNAPSNCPGVGGATSALTLKVGAIDRVPTRSRVGDDYTPNYDKGAQIEGGTELSVVSEQLGNARGCEEEARYETLEFTHTHPTPVTSSVDGKLWVVLGTDSGYEGLSRLLYRRVEIKLEPKSGGVGADET